MMNRTKLPSRVRALAAVIAAALCFAAAFLTGCATPDRTVEVPLPSYDPPEQAPKVHSVAMTYNDTAVDGILSVDISLQNIKLVATVSKDDGASGTLKYDSSDTQVATVDNDGNVALSSKGETVITASYGDAACSVVLNVEVGYVGKYTVTVNGGKASATQASVGDIITLTPVMPEHKDFSEWIYTDSETPVTWINGNMFKMPDGNVTIKAEFTDKLYTLRLIGGKVTSDGGATAQKGTVVGYDGSVKTPEYAITEYKYAYDTTVEFKAVEPSAGRMFVGWDQNTVNNRLNDEETISGFTVPDETTTFWANFSDIRIKKLLTADGISGWNTSSIDGSAAGADPALEGFSGYTVNIPAGTVKSVEYNEAIQGSILNTVENPSQAIRAIFRNRGDKPVTVEVYASYYTNIATSGWVTVPAGQTVTKTFIALLGFKANPWWGFSVRENVGSGADVPLDMVLGCADAYPKGDKTLFVTNGTTLVNLNQWTTQYSWAPSVEVNNQYGWSYLAAYEATGLTAPYVTAAKINSASLPEYDPDDPYLTVYIRMVNQAGSDHSYSYRFFLGNTDKPIKTDGSNVPVLDARGRYIMRDDADIAYVDCTVSNHGQTELLALRIPRSAVNDAFYFGIIKMSYSTPDGTKPENKPPYYTENFSIVLTYNNGIGFDGDIVEPDTTEADE